MTGQEHYAEAERLLQANRHEGTSRAYYDDNVRSDIAAAQVHATLALAQATLVAMDAADWESPTVQTAQVIAGLL